MKKLWVMGLCVATLCGCTSYPPVRYATDGTYQVTARGQILPAPTSARTVLEVPQIPREHKSFVRPDVLAQVKEEIGQIRDDENQLNQKQDRTDDQYQSMRDVMLGTAQDTEGESSAAPQGDTTDGAASRAYYLSPEQWEKQSARAARIVNGVAFNKPSEKEIDQRTRQLMQMSAQVQSRREARSSEQELGDDDGANRPHSRTRSRRRSPLQPLPSAAPKALVETEPSKPNASLSRGSVPKGRYRVFLDFDPSIPVDALETLLGDGKDAFATRAAQSGDRRVFFGAYEQRSAAERRSAQIKTQTGLSPEISEIHA